MVKKIFLTALILLFSSQNFVFAGEALRPKADRLAADFTLFNLENKEVSLSKFKGRNVVLFFWATWCPFCRQELKELSKMLGDFKKDRVELLTIDIGEPPEKVDSFLKTNKLALNTLLDKDMAVAKSYGILGIPTYILIDKDGYIVSEENKFPREQYKDLISK